MVTKKVTLLVTPEPEGVWGDTRGVSACIGVLASL
jgi:hypothetical protein